MRCPFSVPRFRSVVFFAFVCVGFVCAEPALGQIAGDVSGDGTLTIDDALLLADHLSRARTLDSEQLVRADANQDTRVDVADIIDIERRVFIGRPTQLISLPGGVPLELVMIEGGTFEMGSPPEERWHQRNEGPLHTVTIGYDFYMGRTEVTQAQWLAVMASWPGPPPHAGQGLGADYPAYNVSWDDCQNFISVLNAHIVATGQGPAVVRLPSESEWEYAARAGTQTRFYFGDALSPPDGCTDGPVGLRLLSDYMWWCGNSSFRTHPVGELLPNAFGLLDTSGNVQEWVQDWRHSSYTGAPADGSAWESPAGTIRVRRGGSEGTGSPRCRSANREGWPPHRRTEFTGFRLTLTP